MSHEMDELFAGTNAETPVTTAYRRIVTAHDAQGSSVFVSDETCPHVHMVMGLPNFTVTELWKTGPTIASNSDDDPAKGIPALMPPAGGSVFRILEMPPDLEWTSKFPDIPAPTMHRSATIDYAFVIDGEVWAVLDGQELLMRAGDVLIQRETNHGWANRSSRPCRILFVLMDTSTPAKMPAPEAPSL